MNFCQKPFSESAETACSQESGYVLNSFEELWDSPEEKGKGGPKRALEAEVRPDKLLRLGFTETSKAASL